MLKNRKKRKTPEKKNGKNKPFEDSTSVPHDIAMIVQKSITPATPYT